MPLDGATGTGWRRDSREGRARVPAMARRSGLPLRVRPRLADDGASGTGRGARESGLGKQECGRDDDHGKARARANASATRGVGQRARELLREIARSHEMAIHAGAINRDHVHMRLSVPPRLSVLRAVQFLKGKSSRKLLSEYQSLRERYWGQHLWARGYWVASSGNVTDEVWMKYIEDQKPDERDDLTRHRLHRQTGRDVVLLCSSSHEQQGP
jgi:putative transposase